MNFISELFEFGALQIQLTARGSDSASIGFGSHFKLLVASKKSRDLLRENFQPFLLFVNRESEWLEWAQAWPRLNLYSLLR